jgi:hypothetical protein
MAFSVNSTLTLIFTLTFKYIITSFMAFVNKINNKGYCQEFLGIIFVSFLLKMG